MGKVKAVMPDKFIKLRLAKGSIFYLSKGVPVKVITQGKVREGFCLDADPASKAIVVEFQKGSPRRLTASIPMIFAVAGSRDAQNNPVWSITAKNQNGKGNKE